MSGEADRRGPKQPGGPQCRGPDQARSGLRQDPDGASLPDHRLLLDIESHPLHVGQYDFGRKQAAAHVIGAGQRVHLHRRVDGERAVRGPDQPPQITANAELAAEVARDGAKVGTAAAPDLDPSHRLGPRHVVQHARLVDLDLTWLQPRFLASSRQLVCAFAVDLHRGKSRGLLEDPPGECLERRLDVPLGQWRGIADRLALRFGVVGGG